MCTGVLHMDIFKVVSTGILLSVLGLSGCSGMSHQEKGTVAGAAVGGVIGHEVSKDKDKK